MTGSAPAVSVVIPVFRRQAELDRAFRALALQTFKDFEVVVVDDGSPEPVSAREGVRLGLRVRLLRAEPNGGANRARNMGVAAASAPMIAFLDSDDLWFPEKLERQLIAFAAMEPARQVRSILACRCLVWGENALFARPQRAQVGVYASAEAALCAPGALVQTSALLLQTALARALPFDESLPTHHEPDLILRLYATGGEVVMQPDVLAVWDDRQRPGRFSAGKVAATEAWWAQVERTSPGEAWRHWRRADEVQRLRAEGGAPLAGLVRLAGRYGVAAALKSAVQLAAPGRYRAVQERRFAATPGHALDGDLEAAFRELLRSVEPAQAHAS